MTVKESFMSPQTWVPLSGVLIVGAAIFGWLNSAHEEAMENQQVNFRAIAERENEWHEWEMQDQQWKISLENKVDRMNEQVVSERWRLSQMRDWIVRLRELNPEIKVPNANSE